MPIVSQGNSVVVDVGAHDGLWIKSTGSAEVTINQVYAGTPDTFNVTTDVLRVGFYGEPVTVSIRAVSGIADYQSQQFSIQSLTAVQDGDRTDSSPLDVKLAVNGLANSIQLNNLAFDISAIQPTVTVSAAGAATSIPNSVRIQPMMSPINPARFQCEGDPNFRITSLPSSKALLDAGDIMRAELLTGGSAQNARWRPYVDFTHTGQRFEIFIRSTGVSTKFWIFVNGLPLTADTQTITTTGGARHRILVDFGSIGVRDIRFVMQEWSFGGVFVEPFGSITAADYKRKKFAVISDSTGAGAAGVDVFNAWPFVAAGYLNMDCLNLSVGGSGYIAAPAFQTRLQDVIDANPDYLFVAGGWNDLQTNTTQAIMAAFNTFIDSVKLALPNCRIIIGGVHMNSQDNYPAANALESSLLSAALQRGYPFVSQRDPQGILAALPAFEAGKAYRVGDSIRLNELPFVCHTAYTAGASVDLTKFRCTALFSGTGKVGSVQNNGNLDICLTSDGVHFTVVGMSVVAASYAEQIAEKS